MDSGETWVATDDLLTNYVGISATFCWCAFISESLRCLLLFTIKTVERVFFRGVLGLIGIDFRTSDRARTATSILSLTQKVSSTHPHEHEHEKIHWGHSVVTRMSFQILCFSLFYWIQSRLIELIFMSSSEFWVRLPAEGMAIRKTVLFFVLLSHNISHQRESTITGEKSLHLTKHFKFDKHSRNRALTSFWCMRDAQRYRRHLLLRT